MEKRFKLSLAIDKNGVTETYEKAFVSPDLIQPEDVVTLARWALQVLGYDDELSKNLIFFQEGMGDDDFEKGSLFVYRGQYR